MVSESSVTLVRLTSCARTLRHKFVICCHMHMHTARTHLYERNRPQLVGRHARVALHDDVQLALLGVACSPGRQAGWVRPEDACGMI